ncbi:BolA-like protein domain containing protein,expressed [Hordeum vulgare]|nr:BolA-like protein domain containing protein,expressed [Hordeum vulgare]
MIDLVPRCGASYEIEVVSGKFEGKRLLERHRMVKTALAPLMAEIHAVSIKALTPAQPRPSPSRRRPPSLPTRPDSLEDFDEFSDVEDLYSTLPMEKVEALEDMVSLAPSSLIKVGWCCCCSHYCSFEYEESDNNFTYSVSA